MIRTPAGRRTGRLPHDVRHLSIAATVVVAAATLLPALRAGATNNPSPVSTLQSKASALASKIATIQVKLQVLSEEYDQAATREALLRRDIRKDERQIDAARTNVSDDKQSLQRQTIDAYVSDGATSDALSVLTGTENAFPAQQTYLEDAAGSLSSAMSSLRFSEHALVERTDQLSRDGVQSRAAMKTLNAARANAAQLDSDLTSTQRGVNGSLATAVANQQKQEAIQAAAQAAAASVIKRAQQQSDAATSSNPAVTVDPTDAVTGDQQGLAAVHAAESQIGVPYVWSASSPGYGFDCSGLTMWSWGQAGVSLPHSADDQYYSIEHIPFSELQPGDLIFYAAGGYIYHVVMYIGNGQVIQAIQTGTTISITAVPPGAFAAGRP